LELDLFLMFNNTWYPRTKSNREYGYVVMVYPLINNYCMIYHIQQSHRRWRRKMTSQLCYV